MHAAQECDDGNNNDTDGCSNCTVDEGYFCRGQPSDCNLHNCSDGFITRDEDSCLAQGVAAHSHTPIIAIF